MHEEDMITYDIEEEVESTKSISLAKIGSCAIKPYTRSLTREDRHVAMSALQGRAATSWTFKQETGLFVARQKQANVKSRFVEFNLTPSGVCNLWKQFQDTRSFKRKPGQGRPRETTAREDRHLSIIARRNRERGVTASQLSRYLYATTGSRVSRVTVSKRLHERGLFARRPSVCIPLTSMNRRVHLTWCKPHRD
ncbi:transposable element Tcb2 transposase [Trichonephila clavipes]|nr:transposable element Tcb2 transposase [Trichonephila clavipes]